MHNKNSQIKPSSVIIQIRNYTRLEYDGKMIRILKAGYNFIIRSKERESIFGLAFSTVLIRTSGTINSQRQHNLLCSVIASGNRRYTVSLSLLLCVCASAHKSVEYFYSQFIYFLFSQRLSGCKH